MPPAVLASPWLLPAVVGTATVASGALQARATNKATKASSTANAEALAYAKEQEAQRRADYERAYAEWQAGRQALLSRYGISVPSSSAPRIGAPTGGAPSVSASTARPAALIPRGPTLASAGAEPMPQGEPYERWNDWRSYGLPSA